MGGLTALVESKRDHRLRERVILRGFTEVSSAFVLNPDDRIVGIMALIVHYRFHQNVGRDRKGEEQRGQSAAQQVGRDEPHAQNACAWRLSFHW